MATETYSLAEVLAVAKTHPFYNPEIAYPANAEAIHRLQQLVAEQNAKPELQEQPLLGKKTLYKVIERLTHDVDPRNTYRECSYMSITGGGSGGVPMMFAVDAHENRQQRLQMGKFLKLCGVIQPGDWVLSTHLAGGFYRSLDLMTEIMENAGATVLSAGSYMPPVDVAKSLADYHVNILTGDGSQVVQTVYHISLMAPEDRNRICLEKIVYTSEPLTGPQRAFIKTILGDVKIISVMGSAEAGPWAISSPDLTGEQSVTSNSTDFIIDMRNVLVEIVSPSAVDGVSSSESTVLPEGEQGLIVQTSLQRLRNPLVRYITGDIGSIHPLPDAACAVIPEADREHLRVLRMRGRDHRFSFKWYASYFEFERIDALMREEDCGILQWQIILDRLESTPQATLEIRLLRSPPRDGILSNDDLIKRLEAFFLLFPENEHLFRIVFLDDLKGFERSATAGKVIKFVNRWS
ncbi:uncharacterized protein N7479_001791 [Penicillium vulpinum]|uniref:AMP-dependent synthetase/ligase domain-containing protein n=1 Tax=Penicillium vulpinum TaxID=29845 RepID=A0A1V6RCM3_9EURO|nr:uncharacterized protein N7479_001791 [Penicillium vulpinum]KAJ5971873.1 hypothetical protein N7479_001791 [Penicillium vulpinum]OQD98932.1 hypothetical protein PENVUL_c068G02979 [Penicillium vulpinum]